MSRTPFRYLHHLVTVPVLVDGSREARFVLDTGIGLTLLSERLRDELGCEPTGSTFTGTRMSGQEVTVPLAVIRALALGHHRRESHVVGVLDTDAFPGELSGVDGFLSLAYFEPASFTVDYAGGVVVVETERSLAARAARGTAVGIRLERQGPALDAFMPLTLPGRGRVEVEVDTGSDALILDESLAAAVGVRLDDPSVRRLAGLDETGNPYVRHVARLAGAIHPPDAPSVSQLDPDVVFQRIVYDGLVGDAFLRNFVVTYDLRGERMIFG